MNQELVNVIVGSLITVGSTILASIGGNLINISMQEMMVKKLKENNQ